MAHYIALIEDAGPDTAIGVWFPDLPGCFSAGDDIDEALRNAPEALQLYAQTLQEQGKPLPHPRTLTELRTDPKFTGDINNYIVALIELRAPARCGVAAIPGLRRSSPCPRHARAYVVIASRGGAKRRPKAKQSRGTKQGLDCFVATALSK